MSKLPLRYYGDPVLREVSTSLDSIENHIKILAQKMAETMNDGAGIGMEENQNGKIKKLIVVDIGDNDIVDYEVDKVNSPERPLPSQIISLKEAKIWSIILFIFAVGSGLIIDYRIAFSFPIATFWAIQNSLLLDAYNKWLKKSGLFGNLVVAYVVWALFIFADIVVSNKPTLRVESIGLYAFFMNWGREVIKGIRDIDGDRESGIKTIAVRFGPKGGAIGGSVLLLIAVAWTIPLILYPTGSITIPIILLIFDLVIIYRCIRLISSPTAAYANSTKRLFLYLMLIAVITLLIDQIMLFI